MSTLGEMAAEVRAVAAALPLAPLEVAASRLEEATVLLAQATEGSSNPKWAEAVAAMSYAHSRALELLGACAATRTALLVQADRIASGSSARPSSTTVGAPTSAARPASWAERIERARRNLPEGSATQAEGRWLGPGADTTVLRSGKGDRWHDEARAFMSAGGPRMRPASRLETRIEVKMAMRMRAEGRMRGTIVIDREVCGRRARDQHQPVTCDRLLSWFLPPGAELTVAQRDGTVVTYRGGIDT